MDTRGSVIVLGLDLAGSPRRPTGICVLDSELTARTIVAYSDEEILESVRENNPNVVAIDAPLSIPLGRKNIEDKEGPHLRECDKQLISLGIRFFPVTLGPMRRLTTRGMRLNDLLCSMGFMVIEVYPGGAQDMLGIPRKSRGLKALREGLEKLGIKGLYPSMSGDELDAVTAAYVGLLYLRDEALVLRGADGAIVMPQVQAHKVRYRAENEVRRNFR
ncbi:MAG: DUF429 domain-containing protein [Thermofilaceae archaeon]|nr:DUF429 domain-containing protein [Thermofilaceae archaeon]